MAQPEPEPHAGQEPGLKNIKSFIEKLNDRFCYVYNPKTPLTRYYIIRDGVLMTFRWSEIESGILVADEKGGFFSAVGGSEIYWSGQSLARENYLNSKNIESNLVAGTVEKYKVGKSNTFDFKLLTEETGIPHTREPTQYAWKMGMGCEDTAHNLAGQASDLAEAAGYDPASSKIDHAVYVERNSPVDTNYLKLVNYQLLNTSIFERIDGTERPGDHPSDHSAIFFDIYSSNRDTGHKLFSWNAEGFCNVIPWFTNSPDFNIIDDIINGDNINFGEVYKLCSLLNKSILSQEETRLDDKPIDTLISEASVIPYTSNDEPGGFSSLKQWMDYISLFKQNNCKILMIQELFLKDFLKGKTPEEAGLCADKIANFIISLLRLNADEEWKYKWDTYTGMILWSPEYNEVHSEKIERNQGPISEEGGAVAQESTGAVDEALEEDFEEIDAAELEEGGPVVYNSKSPKYSTFISLQRGEEILNLVNIHLKALSPADGFVNGAFDVYALHIYELQNIMERIPHTPHQYYLIGDFNCQYVDQLMRNLFVEECDSERRMKDTTSSGAYLEAAAGTVGAVAQNLVANAFDLGSAATAGLGSIFGKGGGKKHKSTRRKRKSTRRKHKKTHKKSKRKKSKRKKSYKKKRKTKRK